MNIIPNTFNIVLIVFLILLLTSFIAEILKAQ